MGRVKDFCVMGRHPDVQMDTIQLDTSHSQHVNSGETLGIGRCD